MSTIHKLILLYCIFCALSMQRYFNVDACSSRTVPKPRPASSTSSISSTSTFNTAQSNTTPRTTTTGVVTTSTSTTTTTTTTPRPNITFPTYKCPEEYDTWYCLNDAACFSLEIGGSVIYNCECAIGFMGMRCEYKELDGSYLPNRPRPILEKASIASGATCALLFMLILCVALWLRYDQRASGKLLNDEEHDDEDEENDVKSVWQQEYYDGAQCDVSGKCRRCCCCCADDNSEILLTDPCDQKSPSFMPVFDVLPLSFALSKRTIKM